MINVSRSGARIFLDTPPPTDRPVWVFLETPERSTVVKARVVEVRMTSGGQCAARVTFDEQCPYAFFEAAVCGLTPADPKKRVAPAARGMAASRTVAPR
jgi:hypothetical protein